VSATTLAPRFTITNSITLGLTAIERARGFLEAATLSDEWIERMSRRALLLEAHPVLGAGIAQFQLAHIHPFVDGNGRTSRLLSTLHLYRAGYDFKRLFTLSEFYDRDRNAFYRAIQGVREHELDLTGWLNTSSAGSRPNWRRSSSGGRQRFGAMSSFVSTDSTSGKGVPSSTCSNLHTWTLAHSKHSTLT